MSILFQPLFIVTLFILVRAGDLAISYGIARETIRAVLYGLVALFALIWMVVILLGLH